eukprot:CAMPEP_0168445726 /NCGR_PEP_ID=MMETSP0228-20121227/45714_1 /TAXON_ID=133427 /ORGANISM="Protoceratium reticulatum, Strain CCCM 535 (=CCMP 1889)" /LENGTH=55 /DNA_ID=CAMNT_0008460211 /DNA_START=73 /DNA_END=236 /DNA_ORIENTATION=-
MAREARELPTDVGDAAHLECDYLVVGAGAQGLAFTESLVATSKTCNVIIVDRRDR